LDTTSYDLKDFKHVDKSEKGSSEVGFKCTNFGTSLAPMYERWRASEGGRLEVWAQTQLLGPNEVRCSFVAFFINTS
jgi:hypothetical protein